MRNRYRIVTIIFISIIIVISSCKKEDEVIAVSETPVNIYGCTDLTACNYDPSATIDDGSCDFISCIGCTDSTACNYDPLAINDDGSCGYVIGCTDSLAFNYDILATCDDGSCTQAYDIALGNWGIIPDCEEIDLGFGEPISLNELMPETIDIEGNGANTLYIDMNGSQVSGEIDYQGNILVSEQTISIDFSGTSIPVDVEGTGKVVSEISGYMDLTYSGEIDIIPNLPIPLSFSATCHIELSK